MGHYTELIFGASLHKNTPSEIIETIKFMIGNKTKINVPVFKTSSGRNPLIGSSAYFAVISEPTFTKEFDCWHLHSRANIKNYEREIENFLEWIEPYVEFGSGA